MEVVRSVTCLIRVNERKLGISILFKASARGIVILRGYRFLGNENFTPGLVDAGVIHLRSYPLQGHNEQHHGFSFSQASPIQILYLW